VIFLIFSSIEFLLWFLPIFLIVYGITPRKYRNLTLLVGSIVFYARGDVRYLPLLMISILCNYFLGLHLAKRSPKTLWRKKLLLIHELTDETYSLVATTPVPDGVDKGWFYLFISMLDHVYWIIGCTFGALFGSLVNFNTKGVDFVMTALFIVIFTDQWLNSKNHIPAITGVICSVICLLLFGPDRFIIPAMLSILTILTLLRKPLEEHMEREDQKGDDSHA